MLAQCVDEDIILPSSCDDELLTFGKQKVVRDTTGMYTHLELALRVGNMFCRTTVLYFLCNQFGKCIITNWYINWRLSVT